MSPGLPVRVAPPNHELFSLQRPASAQRLYALQVLAHELFQQHRELCELYVELKSVVFSKVVNERHTMIFSSLSFGSLNICLFQST